MYTLRLYHENFQPNARSRDLEAQHSILYVLKGSVIAEGKPIQADTASYFQDVISLQAGPEGAVVWRWDLVRTDSPNNRAAGEGIESHLRMARRIRMFELTPTSKWQFKLDCIYNNKGSTGLHSHPGSGIRCLLAGELNVVSDKGECSCNNQQGDCWYEEGSYPLVSTSPEGTTADFLRGMVLPVEYEHYPDTAMWIEGVKSCESEWKLYASKIVTLK